MELKLYQIDAFADEVFKGNPAAVITLDSWLSDELMQNIAAENNLAETAFIVKTGKLFEIRWFTPTTEVDLCGHATLASAYVIYNFTEYDKETIEFYSGKSGKLIVTIHNDEFTLDFPLDDISECEVPTVLKDAFKFEPISCFKGKTDFLLEFKDEYQIRNLNPDMMKLKEVDGRGIIVTAPGNNVDFVSRFFAPQSGIDEDPVTGSAHTGLTPFWSERLGKRKMKAEQLSRRGGKLNCELHNDRVKITGKAVEYLEGILKI